MSAGATASSCGSYFGMSGEVRPRVQAGRILGVLRDGVNRAVSEAAVTVRCDFGHSQSAL